MLELGLGLLVLYIQHSWTVSACPLPPGCKWWDVVLTPALMHLCTFFLGLGDPLQPRPRLAVRRDFGGESMQV